MNRRRTLAMLALAAAAPSALALDQPARLKRVAIVPSFEKFSEGGREQWAKRVAERFATEGLAVGRDFALDVIDPFPSDYWPLSADWNPAPEVIAARADVRRAREIVATRPDVILVSGDKLYLFQSVTREIPLVFFFLYADPVEHHFVADLRRPGGNITGALFRFEDFIEKGLDVLKELKPTAKRLGALALEEDLEYADGTVSNWQKARPLLKAAAVRLGLEYVEFIFSEKAKFATVERRIRDAKVDLCFGGGPWPELQPFLDRSRILTVKNSSADVRNGALLSVGPSWYENAQNAIGIAAQILRGASPATIPVRMASRYIVAINLKTAKEWGITVPPSVLLRANVVIDESGREIPD